MKHLQVLILIICFGWADIVLSQSQYVYENSEWRLHFIQNPIVFYARENDLFVRDLIPFLEPQGNSPPLRWSIKHDTSPWLRITNSAILSGIPRSFNLGLSIVYITVTDGENAATVRVEVIVTKN